MSLRTEAEQPGGGKPVSGKRDQPPFWISSHRRAAMNSARKASKSSNPGGVAPSVSYVTSPHSKRSRTGPLVYSTRRTVRPSTTRSLSTENSPRSVPVGHACTNSGLCSYGVQMTALRKPCSPTSPSIPSVCRASMIFASNSFSGGGEPVRLGPGDGSEAAAEASTAARSRVGLGAGAVEQPARIAMTTTAATVSGFAQSSVRVCGRDQPRSVRLAKVFGRRIRKADLVTLLRTQQF
jgi:hypothetical protein